MSRTILIISSLVLLTLLAPAPVQAQPRIEIRLTIDANGNVTGVTVIPPVTAITGASAPGVADGGKVIWVVKADRAHNSTRVKVVFTNGTPFSGPPPDFTGRFGPDLKTFEFESGAVNVVEGTFPFRVETTLSKLQQIIITPPPPSAQGAIEVKDRRPPTCRRTDTDYKTFVEFTVQDKQSGLRDPFEVLQDENVYLEGHEGFGNGTIDEVVLTATKIDSDLVSRVQLRASDLAGNSVLCDPIMTQSVRATGKPIRETYTGIPQEEGFFTISNGSPGLNRLEIIVNGRKFHVNGLSDYQELTLDVSPAMIPGDKNIVSLRATGKPGGSALILIWDGRE